MDLPVNRLDKRIKHGDFYCVIPLLVFAKKEEIGFVLGAISVKKELILSGNCRPKLGNLVARGCGKDNARRHLPRAVGRRAGGSIAECNFISAGLKGFYRDPDTR